MKNAQDISPPTILCLTLGLAIGSIFMPEQKNSVHVSEPLTGEAMSEAHPMSNEAALVNVSQGRVLERLPDASKADRRVASNKSAHRPHTPRHQAMASQEVTDLWQHSAGWWALKSTSPKAELASDTSTLIILAACAVLGVLVARVDVLEISAEAHGSEANSTESKVAKTQIPNSTPQVQPLKYMACLVAVCALATRNLSCSAFVYWPATFHSAFEDTTMQELTNTLTSPCHHPVPDRLVLLSLAVFACLASAVAKVDFEEISAQLHDASNPEVGAPPQHHAVMSTWCTHPLTFRSAIALLIATLVVGGVLHSSREEQALAVIECAGVTHLQDYSSELRAAFMSDSLLMLVIAACAALGFAVMRVDVNEMAEQLQHTPEHDSSTSASKSSKNQSFETRRLHCVWNESWRYIIATACLFVTMLVGMTLLNADGNDLFDNTENQSAIKLRQLDSSPPHLRAAVLPDNLVGLVLSACILLGVAIMRIDCNEMTEQSCNAPNTEMMRLSEATSPPLPASRTAKVFLKVLAVAATALTFATMPSLHAMVVADDSSIPAYLFATLAINAIIGLVCMRFDAQEVAEQIHQKGQTAELRVHSSKKAD